MDAEVGKNMSGGDLVGYCSSHLAKTGVVLGAAVALLAGGVGLVTPAMGEVGRANAAMAPSLMQDEKGYISIFEKVGARFACTPCFWRALVSAHDVGFRSVHVDVWIWRISYPNVSCFSVARMFN